MRAVRGILWRGRSAPGFACRAVDTTPHAAWTAMPKVAKYGRLLLGVDVRVELQGRLALRHMVPVLGNLAVLDAVHVEVRSGVLRAGVLGIRLVRDDGDGDEIALGHDGDHRK